MWAISPATLSIHWKYSAAFRTASESVSSAVSIYSAFSRNQTLLISIVFFPRRDLSANITRVISQNKIAPVFFPNRRVLASRRCHYIKYSLINALILNMEIVICTALLPPAPSSPCIFVAARFVVVPTFPPRKRKEKTCDVGHSLYLTYYLRTFCP